MRTAAPTTTLRDVPPTGSRALRRGPARTASAGRRLGAALFLAAWCGLQVVAPAWHLSHHEESHRADLERRARSIDVERLRSPETGRVDLDRLRVALGLGEHAHSGYPAEHHHDPEAPFGQLDGVAEHLGIFTLVPAPALVPPQRRVYELPAYAPTDTGRCAPRALEFLTAQRGQAPPRDRA